MADASIKVDPKQLKNYSNNIKTGYKNMYSYLSESKTAAVVLLSFTAVLMPLSENAKRY